jgi:hypothetical protein
VSLNNQVLRPITKGWIAFSLRLLSIVNGFQFPFKSGVGNPTVAFTG